MKSHFILFALCLIVLSINCEEEENREHYDLSNSADHVHVVGLILQKIKELSNGATAVSSRLNGIDKRFEDLDKRIDEWTKDFTTFKREISNKVQNQSSLTQTTMKESSDANHRLENIDERLNTTAKEYVALKADLSIAVRESQGFFKTHLDDKIDQISGLIIQTTNEMQVFKKEMAKTVNDQNLLLHKFMNETHQHQERQEDQIKTLLDNGLMEQSNDCTTILQRKDGSVDFNRNWTEYKKGFGNRYGEFFIGLEDLHKMTTNGLKHEMVINLRYFDDVKTYAKYDNIVIGSEKEQYILKELGRYSGDAGDNLRHNEGEMFTTTDRDNDSESKENCAQGYSGPWWFFRCNPSSQLFGPYNPKGQGHRMQWSNKLLNLHNLKYVKVELCQI